MIGSPSLMVQQSRRAVVGRKMCSNLGRVFNRVSGALSISPRPAFLPSLSSMWSSDPIFVQGAIRNYAARKGTRERKAKVAKANKAAKKNKEPTLSLHLKKMMMSKMKSLQQKPLFPDESQKPETIDNVFLSGCYKWPMYSVATAISNFKEVHHPTMFDNPKALIRAYFELDLSTKKKTQFVDNVLGVVEMPHYFDTGKPIRTVCLFCKDPELNAKALEAGADVAVGLEGLKKFQEGDLDAEDYDIILSHPDVLPELVPIRGLISKKFPNIKRGTVAFDVVALVNKFKKGVEYKMNASATEPKLGMLQIPIGTVDMGQKEMEENFAKVVEAVLTHKPANVSNIFISIGAITSEYSNERFKVVMDPFLETSDTEDEDKEVEASREKKKVASA